jgi:xylulokinase
MNIEKSLIPHLKMQEARVIGGGSKSDFWNQLKADVLGIPYVRLKREEFGVLGSAILAGYASGVFDDMQKTSDKFNEISNIFKPDIERNKFYKRYTEFYINLMEEGSNLFRQLNKQDRR